MDEIDQGVICKNTETMTRRNWVLQGAQADESGAVSNSDNGTGDGIFQITFSSVPNKNDTTVTEKINNANELNEKILESYRRRHGVHPIGTGQSGGASRAPSFSRQATLVVDESFKFIDNELNMNSVESGSQESCSSSVGNGLQVKSDQENDYGNLAESEEKCENGEEKELQNLAESTQSTSVPVLSQMTAEFEPVQQAPASTSQFTTFHNLDQIVQEECSCSTSIRKSTSTPSLSEKDRIVRWNSQDGEICAVYEKRRCSLSVPPSCNLIISNERKEENVKVSVDRSQRQRLAVSFDDRIVIVGGPPSDVSGRRDGVGKTVIRRIGRLLSKLRRGKMEEDTKQPEEHCQFHSIDSILNVPTVSNTDETVHRSDRPTAPPILIGPIKINPLYQNDDKQKSNVASKYEYTLDHAYYDLDAIFGHKCDKKTDNEEQKDWNKSSQISYHFAHVHSKADERLRRKNMDRFLSHLDFEQLRTKRFGMAIMLMITVLTLAGIGIGLTIYLD